MIDVELFGMWAGGHHLTSVAIHAATTVLLFSFLLGIVANPWTAASLAALWAVHPLRCESVAWVAERKDVLSGLLWMATVLAYARYATDLRRRRAYAAALACVRTGPARQADARHAPDRDAPSRPLAARPPRLARARSRKGPFFGLAAARAVVTLLVQQRGGAVAQLEQVPASLRLANAVVAVPEYLFRTIWPLRLAAFYPFDPALPGWQVAGAAALIAVLTGSGFDGSSKPTVSRRGVGMAPRVAHPGHRSGSNWIPGHRGSLHVPAVDRPAARSSRGNPQARIGAVLRRSAPRRGSARRPRCRSRCSRIARRPLGATASRCSRTRSR